jgi:hypothetical protein
MDFHAGNAGEDDNVYRLEGVTNFQGHLEIQRGQLVYVAVQTRNDSRPPEIGVVPLDAEALNAFASAEVYTEKGNVFVRAYRAVRTGLHRVYVTAEDVVVTVVQFGEGLVEKLRHMQPSKQTCMFCTALLMIAIVFALHAYAIPAGVHALEVLAAKYATAGAVVKVVEKYIPTRILDFLHDALERLLDQLHVAPEFARHPVDAATQWACGRMRLCPPPPANP